MVRAYYSDTVEDFLCKDEYAIFGELSSNDQFSAEDLQKNTWKSEIQILKHELLDFQSGKLLFEYTIPRMGSRIDNVLLYKGIVFLLEFKVGEKTYPSYAKDQVVDYALDLNCFHEESRDKLLVPVLICTEAADLEQEIGFLQKNILEPYCCNSKGIRGYIEKVVRKYPREEFDYDEWVQSAYKPTPTIIEAAQALYKGHCVKEISRSDASAINLNETTKAINDIIERSKLNGQKSICFVTGVPGAGKTLAGLNIAIERQRVAKDEHAVFLSGNGPLVDVSQEALARDSVQRNGCSKSNATREAKEFI